jgi:hypothetical protein
VIGVNAIALILIAAFATDRVVSAILFLLSYIGAWRHRFPDPEIVKPEARNAAEKKQKVIYFVFAGAVGILLAYFAQVRVLMSLGVPAGTPLDVILTGLILAGGSDQVADILKMAGGRPGGEKAAASSPIEIKGTLTLEQPTGAAHVVGTEPVNPQERA